MAEQDVEFDIMLQVQTDPFRMPIENPAVRWPEKLSPFVPAARLHIPWQEFDAPGQRAFANNLYWELSQFRHRINSTPHIEPTGDEVFN